MIVEKVNVKLNTVNDAQELCSITSNAVGIQVEAQHGRYIVDAKSIMGILSLDLTHPITLNISTTDNNRSRFNTYINSVWRWIV